jgi:hypothetical protein
MFGEGLFMNSYRAENAFFLFNECFKNITKWKVCHF